jgi:hypothetical protein
MRTKFLRSTLLRRLPVALAACVPVMVMAGLLAGTSRAGERNDGEGR